MLVIDNSNMKYFTNKPTVGEVLERYPTAKLNLSEISINVLLEKGMITRAQMLLHWSHVTLKHIEDITLDKMTRVELAAIVSNPILAPIALTEGIFRELFPECQLRNMYNGLTTIKADMCNVEIYDILDNIDVPIQVKRHLINKAFTDGLLPISNIDDLCLFASDHITLALIQQLHQLNIDKPLLDPELLSADILKNHSDLSSRLLLLSCNTFNYDTIVPLLNMDLCGVGAEEFYCMLRGPDSCSGTTSVLDTAPVTRRLCQYLANNGMFNNETFNRLFELIEKYGESADLVALYENKHVTNEMRDTVIAYVTLSLSPDTYRRGLFDTILQDGDKEMLNDYCESFINEPVFFKFLQTPSAFKRTGMFCMNHLKAWPGIAIDILRICAREDFNTNEASSLVSEILNNPTAADFTLFLLHSGVPVDAKERLFDKLSDIE